MDHQKPASKASLTEILAELKAEYLQAMPGKLERMRTLLTEENWADLTQEFHKLKGTGKTYGFPEVSTLCERLELLCAHKDTQISPFFAQAIALLEKLQNSYKNNSLFDMQNDPTFKHIMAMKSKVNSI